MRTTSWLELPLAYIGALVFVAQAVRYAIIAGGAYFWAHRRTPDRLETRRLARAVTSRSQALRETRLSLSSFVVLAAVSVVIRALQGAGAMHGFAENVGLLAGVLWFVVLVAVHDTWFYWMHRALHAKPLFKRFHRTHHLSLDPTPLASFAFHPVEAIAESLFVVLVLVIAPVPRTTLVAFQLFSFLVNIYGHLGFEILPAAFSHTRWFKIVNTTTHHHQHHRVATHNYGLYFNLWDRLMATNHPAYPEAFRRLDPGLRLKEKTPER